MSRKRKTEEIRAIFLSERFRNDDFMIGNARLVTSDGSTGRPIAILGNCDPEELTSQLEYRFYGYRENNDKFGPQFKFQTFTMAKPHSQAGIVRYLMQAPNIGQATARALYNKFKADAVRILREQPDVAAAAVSGLTEKKAEQASKMLAEMAAVEDSLIELIDLLAGRKFPKSIARKAIQRWGNKAAEIIQRNPHYLMGFKGCGFQTTDAMYLDLGLPPARMKRQIFSIWNAIRSDRGGHTWHSSEMLSRDLQQSIGSVEKSAIKPQRAVDIATRHGALAEYIDDCLPCKGSGTVQVPDLFFGDTLVDAECPKCQGTNRSRWVAEGYKANAERFIAEVASSMMHWDSHWPSMSHPAFDSLSTHQREKVGLAMQGAICSLGGTPGTGKSYCAAAIVRAIIEEHGPFAVAIACPTGKAAVRCQEAMAEYNLPVEAKTIHRLLEVDTAEGERWTFRHNTRNPLSQQFIVIDETSMLGTNLMASLLMAVSRGTNILLVGDINQLLPVEHGAPLRDLLAAGIPYGELKKIRRNEGTIVKACAHIRDGERVECDPQIDLTTSPPQNLQFITAGKTQAPEKIVELCQKIKKEVGIDPIWDVQVCVAVNKRSACSREALNLKLQEVLNPPRDGSAPKGRFRVSDKVIQLQNGMLPLDKTDPQYDQYADSNKTLVCNGEFGRVLEVHPKKLIVKFSTPDRIVIIPIGAGEVGSDGKDSSSASLDLGYAATVHKMQGSSARRVIVAVDEYPGASGSRGICDRSWLYTAISRAEEVCYLVGKQSTMRAMCDKSYIGRRKTFLKELILQNTSADETSAELVEEVEAVV